MCWGSPPASNTRPACRDPIGRSSEPNVALTRLDQSPPRDEGTRAAARRALVESKRCSMRGPPRDRSVTGATMQPARRQNVRARTRSARTPAEGTSAACTCRDTNVRPLPDGSGTVVGSSDSATPMSTECSAATSDGSEALTLLGFPGAIHPERCQGACVGRCGHTRTCLKRRRQADPTADRRRHTCVRTRSRCAFENCPRNAGHRA